MPRECVTCGHPKRTEIDRRLIQGTPKSAISREYGISTISLTRHFENHVSKFLQTLAHRVAAFEGEQVLAQVVGLVERAHELMNDAEARGSIKDRAAALREARNTVDLLGRLSFTMRSEDRDALKLGGDDPRELALAAKIDAALERRGLPAQCPRVRHEEPIDAEIVEDDETPTEQLALPAFVRCMDCGIGEPCQVCDLVGRGIVLVDEVLENESRPDQDHEEPVHVTPSPP